MSGLKPSILGVGGLSEVRSDARGYVWKRLHKRWRGNPRFEVLIEREFQILSGIQHPFIIRPLPPLKKEKFFGTRSYSLPLERVEGPTLSKILGALRNLDIATRNEWARAFIAQLLSALGYLHLHQVFHLDLCPDNLMIHRDGYLRVIDFGVASAADVPPVDFTVAGRERYRAPADWAPGARDLFAVGRLLEDLLEGEADLELSRFRDELLAGRWPLLSLDPRDWFSPLIVPPHSQWESAPQAKKSQTEVISLSASLGLNLHRLKHVLAASLMVITLTSFFPQQGELTVNTLPTAQVFIEGRTFETPLLAHQVRSGWHELLFVVPSQKNRVVRKKIYIPSGDNVQIFEDFEILDTVSK